MRIDRRLVLLIAIVVIAVTNAHAQVEDISSRFYFPGSLGLGFPLTNSYTHLNDGLTINTAIEYRPTYSNDIFFRIDYDALNNNYTSYKQSIPTNIVQGKLSTDFVIAGVVDGDSMSGTLSTAIIPESLSFEGKRVGD